MRYASAKKSLRAFSSSSTSRETFRLLRFNPSFLTPNRFLRPVGDAARLDSWLESTVDEDCAGLPEVMSWPTLSWTMVRKMLV
jgi:hypothetical protein